jgi:hypothetical protein
MNPAAVGGVRRGIVFLSERGFGGIFGIRGFLLLAFVILWKMVDGTRIFYDCYG